MWTYERIALTPEGSAMQPSIDPSVRLNELEADGAETEVVARIEMPKGAGYVLIRHAPSKLPASSACSADSVRSRICWVTVGAFFERPASTAAARS
jgi:hypothetical protein